jgi:TipAS antibiotic-recognition domain
MSDIFSNPTTDALWEKTFTQEQRDALRAREFTDADAKRTAEEWATLIAEVDKLRIIGEPASKEALELGRKWFAAVREFTGSDPVMVASSAAFYKEGFSSAQTAKHMPFSPEVWTFVGQIATALRARGETIA